MASNLFILPPKVTPADYLAPDEAQKVAGIRLTSSPAGWTDEILQNLLRDHPYIPMDRCIVTFKQRDDALGYAVGRIGIIGNQGLSIPVIIQNRELKPLDLLIVSTDSDNEAEEGSGTMDDVIEPLTQENFESAMDDTQLGSVVRDAQTRGVGYTEDGSAMRLPMRGRTVVASAAAFSTIGASEGKKKEAAAALKDKETLAGIWQHNVGPIVEAWLNADAPLATLATKVASVSGPAKGTASVLVDIPGEVATADIAAAALFTAGGQLKSAVAFDSVSLLHPSTPSQRWLAYEDGTYCLAPEVLVVNKTASQEEIGGRVVAKLASGGLRRGVDAVLVCDGVATSPLKVASITTDNMGATLRLEDVFGSPAIVSFSPHVKTASHAGGSAWVFPTETQVLTLGAFAAAYDQPATPAQVASKLASLVPNRCSISGQQYSATVGDESITQADKTAAVKWLSDRISNADTVLDAAAQTGAIAFGLQAAPANKMAALAGTMADAARLAVDELRMDMGKAFKLAAAIGRPDGADAILSLGFLNEDNLAEFMGMSGKFADTVSDLARLLLAIRMGYPGDENAAAVAMKSLQRVTERLQATPTELG